MVERQYGVWKRRFPVLRLGMRLRVETVLTIIIATAVLHNIALQENEEIPQEWMAGDDEEADNAGNEDDIELRGNENAINVRRLIINEHFARL